MRGKAVVTICLALSVVSLAAAAPAAAQNFTTETYPAEIQGHAISGPKWTFQGVAVECNFVDLRGKLSASSSTVTVEPEYDLLCKAFGFLNASIEENGCKYVLHAPSGLGSAGSTQISCPEGKSITIVAATCTVHIPPQTPTTPTVDYSNSIDRILITPTVEGIHSSTTSGFLCPLSAKSTDTTGKYTGQIWLEAEVANDLDVG